MGRKKKKSYVMLLLIILFLGFSYMAEELGYIQLEREDFVSENKDFKDIIYTEDEQKRYVSLSSSDVEFHFCNDGELSCFHALNNSFNQAQQSIECGLYEFDEENLSHTLSKKHDEGVEISLVVDDRYNEEEPLLELAEKGVTFIDDSARKSRYNNYMHEKFCVMDKESVIFGSANPSENGMFHNDNVMVEIDSKNISLEFLEEFNQFQLGNFGQNKAIGNFSEVIYEIKNASNASQKLGEFELLFCPQENCEEEVGKTLNSSKETIYFATFVMTLDSIENILLDKSLNQNVTIIGVAESRSANSQGSLIRKNLSEAFEIKKDGNKKTMHHKLFIVDERYVIFGSMNPSKSGALYNDEFVVILDSVYYARDFLEEFNRIYNEAVEFD